MSLFLLDDSTDDLNQSYSGDSPGNLLFGSKCFFFFSSSISVYLASIIFVIYRYHRV